MIIDDGPDPSEQKPVKLSTADVIKRSFENLVKGRRHIRVKAFEPTREECLRQLEKNAGLPKGDLSLSADPPYEMVAWPLDRKGLQYWIVSKTATAWKQEARLGYISGSVTVFVEPASGALEHATNLAKTTSLGALVYMKAALDPVAMGNLHISKNCPGVYRSDQCMTCGDVNAS